jgi:sphingomyelin phosphodiesterase
VILNARADPRLSDLCVFFLSKTFPFVCLVTLLIDRMRGQGFLQLAAVAGIAAASAVPKEELVAKVQAQDPTPVLESRSLASEIWNDIKDAAECSACETVLTLLKGVADLGDTVFVDTVTEICKLSGVGQPEDSCPLDQILSAPG